MDIIFITLSIGVILIVIHQVLKVDHRINRRNTNIPQGKESCYDLYRYLGFVTEDCKNVMQLEDSEYSPMSIVVLLIGLIVGGYLAFRFITDP